VRLLTDAEKKQMLAVARAVEFLFSENCALKAVLLSHGVSQRVWEPECAELVTEPEIAQKTRAKWQALYDYIERSPDLSGALKSLLQAIPKTGKVH